MTRLAAEFLKTRRSVSGNGPASSVLVFETSGDGTEDTGGASLVDTASASAVMVLAVEIGGEG